MQETNFDRAQQYITLRARYEAAAQASRFVTPPYLEALFARVPSQKTAVPANEYLSHVESLVSWADIHVLEESLVYALPDEQVVPQLSQQRLRYSQLASAQEYNTYITSALKVAAAPSASDYAELRAELLMLTERINYLLIFSPRKERSRAWLMSLTIVSMLAAAAAIFALYTQLYAPMAHGNFRPTESFFLVLFMGSIGGFISVQQRLQEASDMDPLFKRVQLDASGYSLLISPVIGMVFATLFFVLLLSGIIQGELFPSFVPFDCKKNCDFLAFTQGSSPDSVASWGKLTVWSFAAGFLERLVPDILTRLAATNMKK